MSQVIALAVLAAVLVAAGQAPARRSFTTVVQLETTAEESNPPLRNAATGTSATR